MSMIIRRAFLGSIVGVTLAFIIGGLTMGTAMYEKAQVSTPGLFTAGVDENPARVIFSFNTNALGVLVLVLTCAVVSTVPAWHRPTTDGARAHH